MANELKVLKSGNAPVVCCDRGDECGMVELLQRPFVDGVAPSISLDVYQDRNRIFSTALDACKDKLAEEIIVSASLHADCLDYGENRGMPYGTVARWVEVRS